MSEPLASVKVEIRAPVEELIADLQNARMEVEDFGNKSEVATAKATTGFGNVGAALGAATGSARRFVGSIAGVLGIMTGGVAIVTVFAALILKLSNGFKTGADRANAFKDALPTELDQLNTKVKDLEEQYLKLNAAISANTQSLDDSAERNAAFKFATTVGDQISRIQIARNQEELDIISKAYEDAVVQRSRFEANEKKNADALSLAAEEAKIKAETELLVEATRNTVRDMSNLARGAEIDLLPEEQQIQARLDNIMRMIREGLAEAGTLEDGDVQAAVESYRQFLQIKADLDKDALAERIAREGKAEIEKAERVAKASADALIREMERAAATINASFGFNFNGLDQVAAAIDRHAATGGRRF